MGKLFLVMGKSATGKDHIYKEVLQIVNEGLKEPILKPVVSYTTRPKRAMETDGNEYHFVSVDRMNELDKAGKIIEKRVYHTIYGDWHYFTSDDGQIDLAAHDSIIIVTPEAYGNIRKYFGEELVRPVYIEIDDGERLRRAMKREAKQEKPAYAEMCRRFLADEKDFSEEVLRNLGINKKFINDDFDTCVQEIVAYIESESRN